MEYGHGTGEKALPPYLSREDQGVVLAKHVLARKDIEGTGYPAAAKALGMSLSPIILLLSGENGCPSSLLKLLP